jgi:hypothetical protein
MRELRIFREVLTREARTAAGVNPLVGRRHSIHAVSPGLEGNLLQMPVNVDDHEERERAAGAGNWFQIGISAIGGLDAIR